VGGGKGPHRRNQDALVWKSTTSPTGSAFAILPNEFAKDPDYENSRIADYKYQFGQQFYLVAFKGYCEVNDTMWFRHDILMKDAKKLVLRYEAKNKIDTTTFCTPQFSPGSVKVKKGRKKKK
jgi:hypothetical protein